MQSNVRVYVMFAAAVLQKSHHAAMTHLLLVCSGTLLVNLLQHVFSLQITAPAATSSLT